MQKTLFFGYFWGHISSQKTKKNIVYPTRSPMGRSRPTPPRIWIRHKLLVNVCDLLVRQKSSLRLPIAKTHQQTQVYNARRNWRWQSRLAQRKLLELKLRNRDDSPKVRRNRMKKMEQSILVWNFFSKQMIVTNFFIPRSRKTSMKLKIIPRGLVVKSF